jgi:hypothetical protein
MRLWVSAGDDWTGVAAVVVVCEFPRSIAVAALQEAAASTRAKRQVLDEMNIMAVLGEIVFERERDLFCVVCVFCEVLV